MRAAPALSGEGLRPVALHGRPPLRAVLSVVLVGAVVWSLVTLDTSAGLLHSRGLDALREILVAAARPDLSLSFLRTVVADAWTTLSFALAGMTVAVAIGVPGAVVASGVLFRRPPLRLVTAGGTRGVLGVLRAIHELVWALLFVSAFGLSPWAGVLAIGVPYGAIIGRVVAERLQDVPAEPLTALRSAGASEVEVLLYGRAPQVAADVAGYLLYRFECAVRAAAILSFVGLGGIGFRISLALADLDFERVWTLIFALAVLITALDLASARIRSRLLGR